MCSPESSPHEDSPQTTDAPGGAGPRNADPGPRVQQTSTREIVEVEEKKAKRLEVQKSFFFEISTAGRSNNLFQTLPGWS